MIKNKKILLICKENSSFPMFFLGKELEKNNNEVHYFFVHYTEVLNKNNLNKNTYFYFKNKIKNENIHDVRDINIKFLNNYKNITIDTNRLKDIENKYTHFTSLNKQLLSSHATSTPNHGYFFYNSTTYEENLYWLLLNYDKTETLLDEIKPDYIFDIDFGEIQRSILNEIANYKKIPYVTIDHSRYKKFFLPCFTLGRELDQYFINAYNKNRDKIDIKEFISNVESYRTKSTLMSEIYKGQMTSSYNFNFWDAIKLLLEKNYIFIISFINQIKNDEFKIGFRTPLYANIFKKILFFYYYVFRKFYLLSKFNKYANNPKDEKYIYLPLHKIPESSTYVKSPMYVNEISLIEAISKSMPISWKLYVKEHQSMIGMRDLKFYKKVKKLHNVKIVKSNFYHDPKPWIEKSLGVITITGTSAFEAAMLNKPAIVYGNVFYNVISGIKVAKSFEELEYLFKLIDTGNWSEDNTKDCCACLKTVEELGTDMNIFSIIDLAGKKIATNSLNENEEEELNNMINTLIVFYEKALKYYYGQQNSY